MPAWNRDGNDGQPIDAREVFRVACVQRRSVRQGGRGDHDVVRTRLRGTPAPSKRQRGATKRPCGGNIERKRFGVRLGLLYVRLTYRAFLVCGRHEGTDGQLGERHRGDEQLHGEKPLIGDPRQQDHRAGIQNAAFVTYARSSHSDESSAASMSAFSRSASTGTRRCHRPSSAEARSGRRDNGRSSAMACPSRVTVNDSPRSTRASTRPPSLRSSRTVTSAMPSRITGETAGVTGQGGHSHDSCCQDARERAGLARGTALPLHGTEVLGQVWLGVLQDIDDGATVGERQGTVARLTRLA